MKFSATEKHKELIRELGQRQRVYPRLVAKGSLSQEQANVQTALLQEVADEYRFQIDCEALIAQMH